MNPELKTWPQCDLIHDKSVRKPCPLPASPRLLRLRNRIYLQPVGDLLVRGRNRAAADAGRWPGLPVPRLPAQGRCASCCECAIGGGDRLRRGPREQQQIPVGIPDDEISRTPGFSLERLEERHAGGLNLEEERLDFWSVRDSERRREQLFAIPQRRIDHLVLDTSQIDPRAVARDLCI